MYTYSHYLLMTTVIFICICLNIWIPQVTFQYGCYTSVGPGVCRSRFLQLRWSVHLGEGSHINGILSSQTFIEFTSKLCRVLKLSRIVSFHCEDFSDPGILTTLHDPTTQFIPFRQWTRGIPSDVLNYKLIFPRITPLYFIFFVSPTDLVNPPHLFFCVFSFHNFW